MALSKLSYKPTPRDGHVAVAVGHRQFTWGGYTGNLDKAKEDARSVEVFDLSSEQWEKRPTCGSPPPGCGSAAYTTIGTTLYSFGGCDGHSCYNSLHRLDLSSLEWEEVVPRNPSAAPQRKSGYQMVSFQDNKLVVFAGHTGIQCTDELHVFNLREGTWSSPRTTGDKPPPCHSSTLTKIDDHHAVMFGGSTSQHYLNDVFILELGKWHWTKLEVSGPKPTARSHHVACCLAGPLTGQEHPLLMVVGGLSGGLETFNDGWILNVNQRRWTELDFPGDMQPRYSHTATVFGSAPDFRQVVLHGGRPQFLSDRLTATTLLSLELQRGRWMVTGMIQEDQLGRPEGRPEERLREKMEKLWPSPPPTQQTSPRAEERAATLEQRLREAESRATEAEGRARAAQETATTLVEEAQQRLQEAESSATSLQQRLHQTEQRATQAEQRATQQVTRLQQEAREEASLRQRLHQTEQQATQAEQRATKAEQRATQAEQQTTQAEQRATQAEQQATQVEQRAMQCEERAVRSEERASRAEQGAHFLQQQVADTELRAREATQRATTAEQRLREAEERAHTAERRAAFHQDDPQFWVVHREEIELTNRELGRGGWAVVRVARFRGTQVAAKCLHSLIISDYNRQLFVREMNMAARVRHPNLIQFIGATLQGEPIILTELMATSLRAILERRPLNPLQITSISLDVARALNYLHLMHPDPILHRDVSSANVLMNPGPNNTWQAKVSDYGSANFVQRVLTTGPGNPVYAAPEAANPRQQSPKMDVYSYGVVLLETCTRRFPDSDNRDTLLQRVTQPAMVELIRRCLEQEPERRPTMSEIMEQLERL